MSETLHATAVLPNRDSATHCTALPWTTAVMRVAHRIWRHETQQQLRDKTRASARTVAYWMSRRKARMSVDNLIALMRAEPAHFVPAVLGNDAYQALARDIIRRAELEELRKRQDEQRQLIERLEREAAE